MKKIIAVAVCVLLPVLASAQETRETFVSAAQVVSYGIFKSRYQSRQKGFTDASPAADTVEGVRFIKVTNQIPAELNLGFGIEYIVNTRPKGQPIRVTAVIKFPEGGLIQPHGRTYKESRESMRINIGEPIFYGYGFDEEWEMVPGEWTFEVWYKKSRLVRKRFTVLPAE